MIRNRYLASLAIVLVVIATCFTLKKWKKPIGRDLESMGLKEDDRSLQEQEGPHGVWLMSYPNSGSEIIVDLLHKITRKMIGTNYGNVVVNAKGFLSKDLYGSVPVWTNHVHGPWKFINGDVPSIYVPVVTHCAGTCTQCHPQYYMIGKYDFQKQCATSIKFNPFDMGSKEKGTYDPHIIKKAVHIVRPPLDNVVAEFIQFRKEEDVLNDEAWLQKFPETPDGFHSWCQDVNSRFAKEEESMWPEELWELGQYIPCRQSFYRYVQWHENAINVLRFDMLDIPTKMLHTRELQTNFEDSMLHLIGFLRTHAETPVSEYNGLDVDLPGYGHWYTKEERVNIACFLKRMATKTLSNRIRPYISECDQLQDPTIT